MLQNLQNFLQLIAHYIFIVTIITIFNIIFAKRFYMLTNFIGWNCKRWVNRCI